MKDGEGWSEGSTLDWPSPLGDGVAALTAHPSPKELASPVVDPLGGGVAALTAHPSPKEVAGPLVDGVAALTVHPFAQGVTCLGEGARRVDAPGTLGILGSTTTLDDGTFLKKSVPEVCGSPMFGSRPITARPVGAWHTQRDRRIFRQARQSARQEQVGTHSLHHRPEGGIAAATFSRPSGSGWPHEDNRKPGILTSARRGRPQERERPRHKRSRSPQRNRYFCELFAGVGGLTAAVARVGLPVHRPLSDFDAAYSVKTGFDLQRISDFHKLRSLITRRRVRWLHAAPPCKTFSRGRRCDQFAKARQLRAGGFFSAENLEKSLIWKLPGYQALAHLPGVKAIGGDQCCFGGLFQKPTRWLSNAPCMEILS